MDSKSILDVLTQGGLLGATCIALWALYTERVVPKSRMDELRVRLQQALDGWRESTDALEKNTDALNALTKALEDRIISDEPRSRARTTRQ
jgi:hypothetical protein